MSKNNAVAVLGMQWGDEGKGRIIDALAAQADAVVRFNGGHNAGHTLVVGQHIFKLKLIPCGVVHGKRGYIGAGVVLDPAVLLQEIDVLAAQGITVTPSNLLLAENAAMILPVHRALERVEEQQRQHPLGTTLSGIGPAYGDKVARRGLRLGDLRDLLGLHGKLAELLDRHNRILRALGAPEESFTATFDTLQQLAPRIVPFLAPVHEQLQAAVTAGESLLFEGAQALMLDVDWGSYPYVSASSTVAGAAAASSGLGALQLQNVLGVCKAYCTRVGEGPFPTELFGEQAARIRNTGKEWGTNSGRARRCGWIDSVQLRYAIGVGGITAIALTKLDVLDEFSEIRIAVAYMLDGQRIEHWPYGLAKQQRLQAIYETLPGWLQSTQAIRDPQSLPENAQRFIQRLATLLARPVTLVSVGAERTQLLHYQNGNR